MNGWTFFFVMGALIWLTACGAEVGKDKSQDLTDATARNAALTVELQHVRQECGIDTTIQDPPQQRRFKQ